MKYLVLVTGCFAVGKVGDVEVYRLTQTSFIGLTAESRADVVSEVAKLLSSGFFYFSVPGQSHHFSLYSNTQMSCDKVDIIDFTWLVVA